ncbi:MAG TPA: hypothetical protein DCQ84_16400 [Candidatus Competibacteraceae bacterium]|nr:hypothetical protein [Candidatus Competibacteraceae bacterium]
MNTEGREPEDVSRELLRKSQELLAQVQAMLEQTDRLYQQHGLNRDSAKRFMESNKVPPAQKAKAEQELEQFLQELERDIERDLANAKSTPRKAVKPKFSTLRI